MNVNFFCCAVVFCILLLGSCTDESSTQNNTTQDTIQKSVDYKKLAAAFCECAQESIEMGARLKKLRGNTEEMTKLLPEAGKKYDEAIACCFNEKKNAGAEELDNINLEKALKKNCPQMPKQLIQQIGLRLK